MLYNNTFRKFDNISGPEKLHCWFRKKSQVNIRRYILLTWYYFPINQHLAICYRCLELVLLCSRKYFFHFVGNVKLMTHQCWNAEWINCVRLENYHLLMLLRKTQDVEVRMRTRGPWPSRASGGCHNIENSHCCYCLTCTSKNQLICEKQISNTSHSNIEFSFLTHIDKQISHLEICDWCRRNLRRIRVVWETTLKC